MRKFVFLLCNLILFILCWIVRLWINKHSLALGKYVYSFYISNKIGIVGKGFSVSYPFYLKGGKYVSIASNFSAGPGLRIEAYDGYGAQKFSPQIVIGNNVGINFDCHIGAINRVELGDNVLLASRVFISDHSHGDVSSEMLRIPPYLRALTTKGAVVIKANVWIGEGAVIMPGVTIGEGAIIGANSVVTKDVLPYSVVVGVPIKVIKQL